MAFDERLLHGDWRHSHEEDRPGLAVFRPASAALPPARGRIGYAFEANGRIVKRAPGPTDRTKSAEGTWSADVQGRVTIRIPGQADEVLEVEALEPDRMIVKR